MRKPAVSYDNESLPESYREGSIIQKSPDANEYFGKWDSRTPSPDGPIKNRPSDIQMSGTHPQYET